MGIGTACMIAGVSIGALKAAIVAQEGKKLDASVHNIIEQFQLIPESLLTGCLMGLLMGGIKKMLTKPLTPLEQARITANQFAQNHHLAPPNHVSVHPLGTEHGPPGTIVVNYSITYKDLCFFKRYYPQVLGHYSRVFGSECGECGEIITPGRPTLYIDTRDLNSLEMHLFPSGEGVFVADFDGTPLVTSFSKVF
jgi:hypothetical protein